MLRQISETSPMSRRPPMALRREHDLVALVARRRSGAVRSRDRFGAFLMVHRAVETGTRRRRRGCDRQSTASDVAAAEGREPQPLGHDRIVRRIPHRWRAAGPGSYSCGGGLVLPAAGINGLAAHRARGAALPHGAQTPPRSSISPQAAPAAPSPCGSPAPCSRCSCAPARIARRRSGTGHSTVATGEPRRRRRSPAR